MQSILVAENNANNGCPDGGAGLVAPASSDTIDTAAAALVLGAPSREVAANRAVIPVAVAEGGALVSAAQLDFIFDPSSMYADPATACVLDARLQTHTLRTSLPEQGRLRVLVIDLETLGTIGDGPLLSCAFRLRSTAARTSSLPIKVENVNFSTSAGERILPDVTSQNE
jgi:hypothetical protein